MDKDKRKLTEKESERKEHFEKLSSEMQKKGYKIKNMIINTQHAAYFGFLIMLPFMAVTFWIYNNVNGFDLDRISWGSAVAAPLCLPVYGERRILRERGAELEAGGSKRADPPAPGKESVCGEKYFPQCGKREFRDRDRLQGQGRAPSFSGPLP